MREDAIVTNNSNIPLPLAVWCVVDDYDYSDDPKTISVTTLLKPLRQIVLARQNMDNLKIMDVDNLINVSMGSALHDSVERAWKDKTKAVKAMVMLGLSQTTAERIFDNTTFEQRVTRTVGDWTVSGKYDIVSEGRVCDVKSSSTYGFMLGSSDWQYKMQMSMYRWIDPTTITDDIGTNLYIFTDWSRTKALQDRSYPQSRIQTKDHVLETLLNTDTYIRNKLALIDKYLPETDQSKLPECTAEDLWQKPDVYAYYKNPKSERATKNYNTYNEAEDHFRRDGGVGRIETRIGKAVACQYCSVANICTQFMKLKALGRF